jgi:hypothetical protein
MSEALPYVGAVVGYFVGGPTGAQWGFALGSVAGAVTAKAPHHRGPRLEDKTVVGTDYGVCLPWVSGSPRLAPQFIWAGETREIATTTKQGKGSSPKSTVYTYEVDVGLGLTENVTEDVARDWINSELVRGGGVTKEGVWRNLRVYSGAADQLPDPTYEAAFGVGNVPAYRGITTIVIEGLQLGGGKQLPNIEHQVNTAGEVDLSGVIINAPLTEDFPGTDIAPSPQNAAVSGPTVAFDGDSVTMGPQDDSVLWSDGKAAVNSIPGQPRLYMAFDYAVEASAGASLPGGLQFFFYIPSGQQQNVRWMLRYEADGSLGLVCQNFYTGAGPGGSIPNFPVSGRIGFVWPEGTSGQIDVYLNNAFVTSATAASNMRNPTGIALLSSTTVPSGKHVSRWSYSRFFFGVGYDPAYAPLAGETLFTTLNKMFARAGYSAAEYEVAAELAEYPMDGYSTGEVSSTRAHVDQLSPYGLFETSCVDRIYVRPRATSPVGVIPWEDLGASESPTEPADPFPLQMGNEQEVPSRVAVRYRNALADWNTGTEFADRDSPTQQSTQVIDMPFGLTPSRAKKVAEIILKDAMASLGRATLRVAGRKHARYEPGDVLTTTDPAGLALRFRIVIKRDFLFMIEWEVALDDAGALEAAGITDEDYVSIDVPARVAPTEWEVLAIPPLIDSDATVPGPYVAVTPNILSDSDQWPGAVFVRARLPQAFAEVFTTGARATMGVCLTTLGGFAGGSTVPDWTQTVRVKVWGELASADFYDLMQDRTINAAVIGDEPVRFLSASLVAADGQFNLYDVSGLLRGQLGQEAAMGGHVSGERFVLLDTALRRMVNQTTDIGQEHQVKAVTLNTFFDEVVEEDFTDDGIALRPYSPVYPLDAWDSSGDLTLTWVRRSRLVARYTDQGVFAPVGEVVEAYTVRVFDDPDAPAIRTEQVPAPTWTYSATELAADGFLPGDTLTIEVRQLSDAVGEGFALTFEVLVP